MDRITELEEMISEQGLVETEIDKTSPVGEIIYKIRENNYRRTERALLNQGIQEKNWLYYQTSRSVSPHIELAFLLEIGKITVEEIPATRAKIAAENFRELQLDDSPEPGFRYRNLEKNDMAVMEKFFAIVQQVESGIPVKQLLEEIKELIKLIAGLPREKSKTFPICGPEGMLARGH